MSPALATEIEQFIRERVSERMQVDLDSIGPESDLIALGLQSIDAVLLCGKIEDHFQIEVDPATVFQHATLASFAAAVAHRTQVQ